MSFFSKCVTCNKKKFYIKKRRYVIPQIKVPVISSGELCRKCFNSIKKLVNPK